MIFSVPQPLAPSAPPPAGAEEIDVEGQGSLIDHLLALDPGRRGIASFFVKGGAAAAARSLLRARRVLITTGFTVGDGLPETDGPPGTASLGHALRQLDKAGELCHRRAGRAAAGGRAARPRRTGAHRDVPGDR